MSFYTESHHRDPSAGGSTVSEEGVRLDDAQRQKFGAIADVLIPGGEGMPSATEAKVHEKWIDRAFGARQDLGSELGTIIDRVDGADPSAEIERLRTSEPGAFNVLTTMVAGSYFMNPRVRKLLGYPSAGPARRPAYEDESDHFLRDGLVEAVTSRGPIYRQTPPRDQTNGEDG